MGHLAAAAFAEPACEVDLEPGAAEDAQLLYELHAELLSRFQHGGDFEVHVVVQLVQVLELRQCGGARLQLGANLAKGDLEDLAQLRRQVQARCL